MKTVSAGRMRRQVLFESLTVQLDSDGAHDEVWAQAFDVSPRMPCEVTPVSGRDFIAAAATQSLVTHRLKVRYRPGFSAPRMRGTDEFGTVYHIVAVLPDPDSGRRYLTLLANSGVSPGN
jgi:head-tail adaptor